MSEPAPRAPFVGLRPFDLDDAAWFFGREREVARLNRKVRASAFTAVVGASGSGKSSLVRAGVLPMLRQDGWRQVVGKPGAAPIAGLATRLAELGGGSGDRLAEARRYRYDALLRGSAFGLAEVAATLAPEARHLILVVDQFEELFRYGEEARGAERAAMREEGRAFVELLLAATRGDAGRLHVVITMRSDYFGESAGHRGLAEAVSGSQYLVSKPDRDQLEAAIRGPVQKADASIDEGLVQRLLVDVEEEIDRLPLLQHTLRRLWDVATGVPRRLTEADYLKVGRLAGSIDQKADALLKALADRHPLDGVAVERVMKALTELDEAGRARRRPQAGSELLDLLTEGPFSDRADAKASLDRILDAFTAEEASFLQRGDGTAPMVDIGHEALIRSWQRLAGSALDFKAGWAREERTAGDIWRGYVRRADEQIPLTRKERRRLDAGVVERRLGPTWSQRYGDAWEAFTVFDQDNRRRYRRVAATLTAACLAAFCIAAGGGWYLWQQRQEANLSALRNARLGSISLAELARQATGDGNARAGALLARAALPASSNPDAHDERFVAQAALSLADALAARPLEVLRLLGHQEAVDGVAFSPDGKRLASASADKTVRLWDVATGQPIGSPLAGHQETVWSVAFSPDGKWMASASFDGTVRLWDVATGQPIGAPLEGHKGFVYSVAFSPDGKRLASASLDKTVRLWDAATGQPLGAPLEGHQDVVRGVAFSPDGKRLASASLDRTVRLWDAATGQPIGAPLEGHQETVIGVAFSPNGKRLASASLDKTVRLWDIAISQPTGAPLEGHQGFVYGVAFSPDGKRLASASEDKTVRLWDAAAGQPIGAPLVGHQEAVMCVVFSPDGKRLASSSWDNTVRFWDAATGQPIGAPLKGHRDIVRGVAFSPDGKRLASASFDGTVRLWDVATGQPIGAPLQGHKEGVFGVAFSPDGKWLASASKDKTVRLWDVATGQPLCAPLAGHQEAVWSVAFSPDGKRLASASFDGTVRMWDTATGQPVGAPLEGHQGFVLSVAFSPDGKRLASASEDKTVRFWDAETGQPIGAPLEGHQDRVYSVAFSPDGKWLASASEDKTVRLWDATPFNRTLAELVASAEALCPLSDIERARFGLADPEFPERPREWTEAQRRACGLHGNAGGGEY